MTEIFITRHGETDFNKQRIIQGRGINSSLNEVGRAQAQQFYDVIGKVKFDRIYVSSLNRTAESMLPFEKAGYELHKRSEIDEINWGEFEGKQSTEETFAYFKTITKQWKDGQFEISTKGGETIFEFAERITVFIDELKAYLNENDVKRVLICTHGRTLRALICLLIDVSLSEMDKFHHTNLTLYKADYNDGSFELTVKNNQDHLNIFKR